MSTLTELAQLSCEQFASNPAVARRSETFDTPSDLGKRLERVRGVEPPSRAWEARVLPLNYTRERGRSYRSFHQRLKRRGSLKPAPLARPGGGVATWGVPGDRHGLPA